MVHTATKRARKLVCPSCNAEIHFRHDKDSVGTCPRCGEWLVQRGRWSQRLERLDYEPGRDFDESDDWERSLIEEIE